MKSRMTACTTPTQQNQDFRFVETGGGFLQESEARGGNPAAQGGLEKNKKKMLAPRTMAHGRKWGETRRKTAALRIRKKR
jgi:hypothetical protein